MKKVEKKKPMTASEMGKRAAKVRLKKYSAEDFAKWGAMGGRGNKKVIV